MEMESILTSQVESNKDQLNQYNKKTNILDKIKYQVHQRIIQNCVGLKINLYKAYEIESLAEALKLLGLQNNSVESVMIADSYFMTHLGYNTTRLKSAQEQEWGLNIMVSLVEEASRAVKKYFNEKSRPYLIGDMPDGSTDNIKMALNAAERMVKAGADVIKIEITSIDKLLMLESLCRQGFNVMAHIGYTPQGNTLKRYGDSITEAMEIISMARRIKDCGACSLVLEMVSEIVNQALNKNAEDGMQIYSIFSGKAKHGGQSLNVWDAVFSSKFNSRYFPPTAEYSRSLYPEIYTSELITKKISQLIKLTLEGEFPSSPPNIMPKEEQENLLSMNIWLDSLPTLNPSKVYSSFDSRSVFEQVESEVRVYCRKFPAIFTKAKNHLIWDDKGNEYIDFFAGAGALNYGHNNELIKESLIDYLKQDGITHSIDLYTFAKKEFITEFLKVILQPRNLNYKMQFTGPTGTNAVEAAFKIARKVTGRQSIISFTNGFHGMTLGALAATGASRKRSGAGVPLNNVIRMPYDGYFGDNQDTIAYIKTMLDDPSSGIEIPAAFIVETVQAEGGVLIAKKEWLQRLQALAHAKNILLILDEIQTGCGRTGSFFSFEEAQLYPDIVCLSKSIGGYGLPMALVLLKPYLDQQFPGEHSGTFRGNNLAFVAAKAALAYWKNNKLADAINQKSIILNERLQMIAARYPNCVVRGRGLLWGITWSDLSFASKILKRAFEKGLLVEICGGHDHVLKIMPPLIIENEALIKGLDILEKSIVI